VSENELKPVAWQWQDEIGKWHPVQYEKAMQRGVNGYKVRALFDHSAIEHLSEQLNHYRMAAESEAELADRRQQEVGRLAEIVAELRILLVQINEDDDGDHYKNLSAGALDLIDEELEVPHAG